MSSILIGEALIAQCERAADKFREPHTSEQWRAVHELHDDYPEIWRQLDRARTVLAARGANTMVYEDLRSHARPTIVIPSEDHTHVIDGDALEDARRAIGELKLAVPGADWKAIQKRTKALVETPQIRKKHKLVATAIVGMFVLGVIAWFLAITPDPKPDQREVMRQEIADVAAQRDVRIERLGYVVNEICDPPTAHDYIKLLVMDGRSDDADTFAESYTRRCGEDRVIENWANAPRPKSR